MIPKGPYMDMHTHILPGIDDGSQSTSLTSFADIQISTSLAKDYNEMIYSRPVVQQVVQNLGLDYTYEQA